MKKINEFLNESFNSFTILYEWQLNESNERIFPKNGQYAKLRIDVGDHAFQRQQERYVSNKQVIDAIFGAYNDINGLFKSGQLKVSKVAKIVVF